MAAWAFKSQSTAEALRDLIEKSQAKQTRQPSSIPAMPEQSHQPTIALHVKTEIGAATIDATNPANNIYYSQLCDVYRLVWDSVNTRFNLSALTKPDGTTKIQAWVLNPADEAIPLNTLVWGPPAAGARDGVRVFIATVWLC